MTFSQDNPVRAAMRVRDGQIVAAPFEADGRQTESAMEFGPVAGSDIEERFRHVSWVFGNVPIEG
jgi:hypothetical protein